MGCFPEKTFQMMNPHSAEQNNREVNTGPVGIYSKPNGNVSNIEMIYTWVSILLGFANLIMRGFTEEGLG